MAFDMKDYREVPERIAEWYDRHEHGRIVCSIVERPTETCNRWTVMAKVYRTSDRDEPPAGVGHSFLVVPGKTTFTRDSELENAETSAAGRALVMAGIPAKTVASEQEKQSKGSSEVEPVARPSTERSSEGGGMAEEDGSGAPASGPSSEESAAYGEGAAGSSDRTGEIAMSFGAEGEGEQSQPATDAGSPSSVGITDEQKRTLRETYGVRSAMATARALFEETGKTGRKIRTLNDLTADEAWEVLKWFQEHPAEVSA